MLSGNTIIQSPPSWYQIERETEKTINKLTSMKELAFYLKNTDNQIRRLAIIRIHALKLKDSIGVLEDIMTDPSETDDNKLLAAWTIKSIAFNRDLNLFIDHYLLNSFKGNESYNSMFQIIIRDNFSAFNPTFTNSFVNNDFEISNNDMHRAQDITFSTSFPLKEWFNTWSQGAFINIKKIVFHLPLILVKALLTAVMFILKLVFYQVPRSIYKQFTKPHIKHKFKKTKKSQHSINKNNKLFTKGTFVSFIKGVLFYLLFVLFFPVRFIIRHKKAVLLVCIIAYVFFSFTIPGKLITQRYWNIDLLETQQSYFNVNFPKTMQIIYGKIKRGSEMTWLYTKQIYRWIEWEYIKWLNKMGG